jgi:4-hydroxythreonine-4-phosphate dehydrogenase
MLDQSHKFMPSALQNCSENTILTRPDMMTPTRPTLALAMGDPSGVSLELAAKLLADDACRSFADYIVVGDARALAQGCSEAGVTLALPTWQPGDADMDLSKGAVVADLGHLDQAGITRGISSQAGGAFSMTNFRTVLRMGAKGGADAATFTPFNKHAMRLAYPPYVDEIEIITAETGATSGGREFNILPNLWNARVTSHVPLSGVAALITKDAVLNGIRLTNESMKKVGFDKPRIAVAALNPHAGDGGNFGHEDDAEIVPAVEAARAEGIICDGPFPSDTVFLRAKKGDYDVVQTMYHDQGQIAMKLMGFELGVTLIGGYSFPVCTPAHGTAYDIAGKGIANLGATREAMRVATQMASAKNVSSPDRARILNESIAIK